MAQQTESDAPTPYAGLQVLDKLVGTWKVSGEADGETTYEWMEGGFFLIQHGVLEREGVKYTYRGFIGYDRAPGEAEPAEHITSRLYTSRGGHARLYLRDRRRDHDDLVRAEGLPRVLQGPLERRRQHTLGRVGMAGRRLQGDDDADRAGNVTRYAPGAPPAGCRSCAMPPQPIGTRA